jgi:hypothetical protein
VSGLAAALQADLVDSAAATPPGQLWQPGSGALVLRCACGAGGLVLLMDNAAVATLTPAAMAPTMQAIRRPLPEVLLGDATVVLRVGTGMTNLRLGDIAGLAVGDVIAFDAPIDRPFDVYGPLGTRVGGARLLRDGDHCIFAIT